MGVVVEELFFLLVRKKMRRKGKMKERKGLECRKGERVRYRERKREVFGWEEREREEGIYSGWKSGIGFVYFNSQWQIVTGACISENKKQTPFTDVSFFLTFFSSKKVARNKILPNCLRLENKIQNLVLVHVLSVILNFPFFACEIRWPLLQTEDFSFLAII